MDEYWNLFLQWLDGHSPFGQYSGKRIAPRAELRYADSKKSKRKYGWYDADVIHKNKKKDILGGDRPAEILRYVQNPGDTVYVEYPESTGALSVYPRSASTTNQNGDLYRILRNRYNIAESLAR